jgi:hypothetical protein
MTDSGDSSSDLESTVSAGESGAAANVPESGRGSSGEVVVGEIPDVKDLSHLLWTAECSGHGLLGTYPDRATAEAARDAHLVNEHT